MPDRWWCADYEDRTVWPCEIVGPGIVGLTMIRPLAPAPDAGKLRAVHTKSVYNSRMEGVPCPCPTSPS